jgi:hypothetical protein
MSSLPQVSGARLYALQRTFARHVMPLCRAYALTLARKRGRLRDGEEMAAETIALCWRQCLRNAARGMPVFRFRSNLAWQCACQAARGARLVGVGRGHNCLLTPPQEQHRRRPAAAPRPCQEQTAEALESLTTGPSADPAAAAILRCDLGAFLAHQSPAARHLVCLLAQSYGPLEASGIMHMSQSWAGRTRRRLREEWESADR